MPNWCDTTYKCVSDNKKELRALKKVLDANFNRKKSRLPNGFGKCWIGNIIDQLGYDWNNYRCRGEITDYALEDNILTIYQSTAWCEQEGFREVIQKKFPSITVHYRAEEPGCEVFETTSFDYFPERYYLDGFDTCEYFETLQDAAKFIGENIVGYEVEADFDLLTTVLNKYTEEQDDDDGYFYLHEFEIVND